MKCVKEKTITLTLGEVIKELGIKLGKDEYVMFMNVNDNEELIIGISNEDLED